MGLFKKKEKKPELSKREYALLMAGNVFKKTLLPDETIEFALQGKSDAKKLVFSVGIAAITNKRLLYYSQDGPETKTEAIPFSKIITISSGSGYESKMGSYISVDIELANGLARVVRLVVNDEHQQMLNEFIYQIEERR